MVAILTAAACHDPALPPPHDAPELHPTYTTPTPPDPPPPATPLAIVAGEGPTYTLRSAGDTDGDGADELLVSGASGTLLVGLDGVRARFAGGEQVAPAGDVDGDGLADLAWITAGLRAGVWLGPHSGAPTLDVDLTPVEPTQLPTGIADTTGDVDGDGLSDAVFLVTQYDYAYSDVYSCFLSVDGELGFYEWYFCAHHAAVLADPAHGAPGGITLADTYGLSALSPEVGPIDALGLSLEYTSALRAVGDLDGNGVQDVTVTANQGRGYAPQVLLNPGAPDAALIELRGTEADGAQVAGRFDLDGDGAIDVLTSWWDGAVHHVAVAYGPWAGQNDLDLEIVVADPTALTGAVEAADFDGDGVPDFAVGTVDGLVVYSGREIVAEAVPAVRFPPYTPWDGCVEAEAGPRSLDPSGTPPLSGELVPADAGVHVVGEYDSYDALQVGDFDGDGADDLALGNYGWKWYDNEQRGATFVLREFTLGESSMAAATQLIPGDAAQGFGTLFDAADMDGDGDDDLFAGGQWGGVWLLDGGPTGLPCPQEAPPTVEEAAIHPGPDLDGDGGRDLVVLHPDGQVAVLASPDFTVRRTRFVPPNQTTVGEPILTDWDGDGIPEAAVHVDSSTNDDVWVLDLGLTGVVALEDGAVARRTHDNGTLTVAAAGDLDGDGTDDLWAAYPLDAGMAASSPGRIYGLGAGLTDGDVLGTALVSFEGEGQSYLGTRLAGRGDTDGDGAPELLAEGASWVDRAWLFRDLSPGAHGLDDAVATWSGGADDQWLEGPVAFADLDQDHTDDVVLTLQELVPFQLPVGSVLVYFGGDR